MREVRPSREIRSIAHLIALAARSRCVNRAPLMVSALATNWTHAVGQEIIENMVEMNSQARRQQITTHFIVHALKLDSLTPHPILTSRVCGEVLHGLETERFEVSARALATQE